MNYRPITDVWILARPKVKYYGAYPNGFLERAKALLGSGRFACLHVCGGHAKAYRGIDANRESVARWLDIHPNGGRYGSNLAFLRAEGYLEGFTLTAKGLATAQPMVTGLAAAKEPLDGSERAIVDMLDLNDGKRFTRDTLALVLGIHPNGGRYGSNLARLRTMGLIPERGDIYLTDGARR